MASARIGDGIPGWSILLLALLLAASVYWRASAAQESLWIDELHTAWCAGGPFEEVAPRAAIGNQSPLFFWMEWAIGSAFENQVSELMLRGPSLAAGGALLIVVFVIALRWLRSAWLGLLAAWIVALDPLANYYATEARPYAIVTLVATLHVVLFAELCRRPNWLLRAGFIAGMGLLFHFHYTAALLLPAELLFWLVAWARRLLPVRYTSRQLTLDLALIVALWLPAAGLVGAIFGRRQNWEAFVRQWPLWDLFDLLPWSGTAVLVLAAVLVERYAIELPRWRVGFVSPAAGRPDAEKLRWRRFAILCLCWLLVPLGLAWIATWSDVARLFLPRYLAVSVPAGVLLSVACVSLAPWKWSRVLIGASLAGAALWGALAKEGELRGEDWRGAVAWLNEQLAAEPLPVLVVSDLIEDRALRQPHGPLLEDYCLFPVTSLYGLDVPRSELLPLPSQGEGILDAAWRERLRSRRGAWLIVRTGDLRIANAVGYAASAEVSTADEVWHVKSNRHFGGVKLVLVRPRPPAPEL
jgi:mannosyltransferase